MLELRDWIMVAGFGLTLIGIIINIVKTHTIQNNDLKHLEADVSVMKQDLKDVKEEVIAVSKEQAAMQAVCQERHDKDA